MGRVKTKAAKMKTLMDAHVPYEEGFIDHQHGQHQNPYADLKKRVDAAQAWSSGQEAARRAAGIDR
jgi:hypothetical protein